MPLPTKITSSQEVALKLLGYDLGSTLGGLPAIFRITPNTQISRSAVVKYEKGYWVPSHTSPIADSEKNKILNILIGIDDAKY